MQIYSLGMCKDGTSLIQQVINTELDPSSDNPAKGSVMVECDIMDNKWIVESP